MLKRLKISKRQLILIASFVLLIGSISLIFYKYYLISRNNRIEKKQVETFINIQKNVISIKADENNSIENDNKVQLNTKNNISNYIAVIEIPSIKLKKGLYPINSKNNDVNKNIKILKESNMPNIEKGNLILAAHAGTGIHSYFKDIHKLSLDSVAYIYFNGSKYSYKLVNSYETNKTGKVSIYRNGEKKTLTLITCKHGTDKQIVLIFELVEESDDNGK